MQSSIDTDNSQLDTLNLEPSSQLSPSVTVGIPFYTGVDVLHLRQAIDSILNQTLLPSKIHLIQDGPVSEDHQQLVRSYVEKFSFVEHLVIEQNSGLPYALNLSILKCATKYYARMDSDDISHPQRLMKQVEFLESHRDVDILGTWAYEFEDSSKLENATLMKVPTTSKEIFDWSHYRNPLIHPSVIFRYGTFVRLGLYDTRLKTGARDLEMWIRALKSGLTLANLPEPLLYYRCGDSVIRRRARIDRVLLQAQVRFSNRTWSPRLNALKTAAILFRLMPLSVQRYGYSLRNR